MRPIQKTTRLVPRMIRLTNEHDILRLRMP